MKKITSKSLSVFLTLCCVSLFAEGDQIPFNSNPLSSETQVLLEQIEKQKEEKEAAVLEDISQYLQVAEEATAALDAQGLSEHTISSFPQENIIKIEDGSEWSIDQSDVRNLRSWKVGHIILLYQNKGDTNKPYMLENTSINRTLKVNPFNGPKEKGPKTNWVVGIDKNLGHVYLINGSKDRTSWAIDKTFLPIFQEWVTDETIIVMTYHKSWAEKYFPRLFPSYDYVLLNVNEFHNIPAKPL